MSLSATSKRLLNTSRDGDSTTFLGSLFQCLITLSLKTFFLISNLNLPWHKIRLFSLVLSLATWEKVTNTHLATTSFQTLHQLRRPSLDTLQHLNVSLVVGGPKLNTVFEIYTSFKYLQGWRLNHFPGQPLPMLDNPFSEKKFPNIQSKPPLVQLEAVSSYHLLLEKRDQHPPRYNLLSVRGPKLNTVFEVQPHYCQVQGDNHFPSPAGHAIFDTSQDAIGFLGHLGTLLAHIQEAVNQHPQVLFCQAAFQPLFPKPVALHEVAVAQVQDLALSLVEPHTIGLSPSIQSVQNLSTLKQNNTPAQLGVVCKLTEGALNPLVQIIVKDIEQNWPQYSALENTTCDWTPTGFNSIHHHHSLGTAIQPVLYPAKNIPI
ncbi:hypothetical protein QYF61_010995 [Mycteria americana]|uniref:Uncharacterized protein n=1 Tax=Mycteria americana TaxID=33587 RepID=A0AAN7S370_MYCAM|nr:hypothetical protein QYF61_010995 [Mycteria americana]